MKITLNCLEKAVLSSNLKDDKKEAFMRSSVALKTLANINPFTISGAVDVMAQAEHEWDKLGFSLPYKFQKNALIKQITTYISRYCIWEQEAQKGKTDPDKIIGVDLGVSINLFGERYVPITYVIDRGSYAEFIRFRWKAPDTRKEPKKFNSPEGEMFIETREAAKKIARNLKIEKPIRISIYSLKAYQEKELYPNELFEVKSGSNVHSFTFDGMLSLCQDGLFRLYLLKEENENRIKAGLTKDGKGSCFGCEYADLCHISLVPRKGKIKKETKIKASSGSKAVKAFNPSFEQQDILALDRGIFSVQAPAGSGKTSTVAGRVINLAAGEAKLSEILLLTFTVKGAEEMKAKFQSLNKELMDGELDVKELECATFNGWCQKLIEEHYDKLGFTDKPKLVEAGFEGEVKELICSLLDKYPVLPLRNGDPFNKNKNTIGSEVFLQNLFMSLQKGNVNSLSDMLSIHPEWDDKDNIFNPFVGTIYDMFLEYKEEMKRKGLISYADQEKMCLELANMGVFKTLPYKHVIVDEAQDCNRTEFKIVEELNSELNLKSLMFVGDVAQSIYRFKDASPELFRGLVKTYPTLQEYPLLKNYRSDEAVIALANQVLERDEQSLSSIKMIGRGSSKGKVSVLPYGSADLLEAFIIEKVNEHKDGGYKFGDIAILARKKSELEKAARLLAENGIPSRTMAKESFKDNPYVKVIFGLCEYLAYDLETGLALYSKYKGIDIHNFEKIKEEGETLRKLFDESAFSGEDLYKTLLESLQEIASNDFVAEEFLKRVEDKGFTTYRDLITFICDYDRYNVEDSVEIEEEGDGVLLYTIHAAKGLEFPCEILLADELSEKMDNDEEKRLLYVGITRARDNLLVIYKESQKWLAKLLEKEEIA